MNNKSKLVDFVNTYKEKDLTVILEGAIETFFVIHNSKILMNDYRIIFTDSHKEELNLNLDEIEDISMENYLVFYLNNQKVIIDY